MTPEETIRGLENLIKECQNILPKVEEFAANEMFNTLAVRIFDKKFNTAGFSLGKYKKAKGGKASIWQVKRFDAGRQTQNVDLNFTGNLFIAFTKGLDNGKWVVGFRDNIAKSLTNYSPKTKKKKLKSGKSSKAKAVVYPGPAKLSKLIEENMNMVIFTPSVSEVNQVIQKTNIFAAKELDKLISKHLK